MKNIVKIGLTLCAGVMLSSCIQETFPTSIATSGQTSANPAALEAMVSGMAASMNYNCFGETSRAYDYGYASIGLVRDIFCDNMASIASGYDHYTYWLENQYQGDNYIFGQFIWNFYTTFLNSANSVIRAVDAETADDLQQVYLAMAYCFRSMINLDMGRMYEFKPNKYTSAPEVEGLTISIIKENLTEAEARKNPRVSKDVLIEYIEGDLMKAIDIFKKTGYQRDDISMPDLSVAYGLLARLYMWKEDYPAAKTAAQNALNAGNYSPLTEAQWTDTSTGFNNATTQKSWMWASYMVKESLLNNLLNWISWIASETDFGYAAGGPYRMAAVNFYNQIPDTDFRKKSWKAPEGSPLTVDYIPATAGGYGGPDLMPDLATVKFRPANGDPNDWQVGAAADYPMMRMEEMQFIIAEADARNGNSHTLETLVKTRNPQYTCTAVGDALIEEVFFQKSVEFWGEGIIFFDYKRLNHSITRGYEGTNYYDACRFNTDGLAPWMNLCIVRTEQNNNSAFVNNPDPSGAVDLWISAF